MEAKSNKEYLEQIRQTRVLGCASFGKICQQEIAELAFRLEAAEKQIRLLKAYAVYTETGTGEFSRDDAEAIEQIVKEERGEK